MWTKVSIKKRVMAELESYLDASQKAYDAEIEAIDREADGKKIEAADNQVRTILNKFR